MRRLAVEEGLRRGAAAIADRTAGGGGAERGEDQDQEGGQSTMGRSHPRSVHVARAAWLLVVAAAGPGRPVAAGRHLAAPLLARALAAPPLLLIGPAEHRDLDGGAVIAPVEQRV